MRDFLIGLAFIMLGGVVLMVASQYPTMSSLQYGPSLFPSLIGGGIVIGGLVISVSQLHILKKHIKEMKFSLNKETNLNSILMSLSPCALMIFYILFSEYLGALICMSIMIFILMIVRKVPLIFTLITSISSALIIYFLFSHYLLVPLPEGLLDF
ncbi:tripartite Tricarboxylate transporter (TTT) family protein, small transmembrane protein [Marinomonas ushuaiensis DSM 15871]|uniref:Tripartite Tricarboxylate transporter (TTT) family protein, small transmembrane protein n=1 Tax=Marinomonas ushuaiensis DSM 15871 TaxID=1122207 RepID=X7E4W4_9GAMM|nr:tripartite tricarboxylate transporter TctB family protein [Marinomonas ushuaiensis]ETX10221.1 tripartite Tricarboxylate transporter (TTT) family protein, small transmembrane protein [Marinomonas ushuaiensis DSM 15871]